MSDAYPVTLHPAGRRVCVVGGGPVSARRTAALVAVGADVLVVAPQLCEDLRDLAEAGRVTHRARPYRSEDLDGAWLVHCATGLVEVDEQVGRDAEQRRVWCTRADDAGAATAWTPAVARVDDVTVAQRWWRPPPGGSAARCRRDGPWSAATSRCGGDVPPQAGWTWWGVDPVTPVW